MGHPARQRPDCLHLLRVSEVLLRLLPRRLGREALGNVPDNEMR